MLTGPQLRAFLPTLADPVLWTGALNLACTRFEISTPARLAAFLAQVAHESSGFTRLVENLNYSAVRLMQVWPRRFPTLASAQPYAHQPERLANHVYANRLGNGPDASGDGWKFRGRGLIQLTGRLNYRTSGTALELPLGADPDQVATPLTAALTAAQFWDARALNALADLNTLEGFDAISRRINGGAVGLTERRAWWWRAKAALV